MNTFNGLIIKCETLGQYNWVLSHVIIEGVTICDTVKEFRGELPKPQYLTCFCGMIDNSTEEAIPLCNITAEKFNKIMFTPDWKKKIEDYLNNL